MISLCLRAPSFKFSFLKFSKTLQILQQTASTTQKVQVLSNYIKSLNSNDKQQTKKLFDFVHEKISTGVSDKLLINQFHKFYGTKGQVSQVLKNKETSKYIERFIPQDKQSQQLQVQAVNKLLKTLTQIQGKNSVQNKSNLMFSTLNKLSFIQARFFLRILTKDMKIGMKSKLVLKAYQDALQSQNNPKINFKNFNPMLARPLRDVQEFQKFCLKKNGKILADVKYDGQRTLITFERGKKIILVSRNGKQQNDKYFKIAYQLQKLFQKNKDLNSITLDAQIVAVEKQTLEPLPFQVLLTRKRREDSALNLSDPNDDINILEMVYAFDCLQYNGQTLYTVPLIQRRNKIIQNEIIKKGQALVFQYPQQKDKLMEYFHQVVKRKYEGLILKGPQDCYFTNGSRIHWGKLKKGFRQKKQDKGSIDLDLIVMGADYGKGKKDKVLSSFLMGIQHNDKIIPLSKVGSGFDDQQLQQLTETFLLNKTSSPDERYQIPQVIRMDVWFSPQKVAQIDCQQLTRSPLYRFGFKQGYGGISLRFPVFKRLRDDKNIQQATDGKMIQQEMEKQQKPRKY